MSTCQNDPNKSSTTKISKHTPSGYSIFTNCSFDELKNQIGYYRGDGCIKEFCKEKEKDDFINNGRKNTL